ncbi:siderophore-interacting protein [Streptomyces longispororuber]|uniref:siderophore-interacting protein n=1 Tax=Streptomyces longispororuber TaxID=68230 RepID=UPI00210A64B0|nr:siderophore-interacting protein [Streptomyces longispororuber]MCQ4213429.1 siderophore-interacting protein [Streptomyces longispororuber]
MTNTAAPADAPPFDLFDLHVVRARHLTPNMVRVDFGGDDLSRMRSAGRDQRIKLFLPAPGQDAPHLPDNSDGTWYPAWQALDPATRGVMRTYTIRDLRTAPAELTVDFAVHGDEGPASRWALRAAPGDRVGVLAPVVTENVAYEFRPPADTDWVLLAADASALPAVAAVLAHLSPNVPVRAWIEVPDAADQQELPIGTDTEIVWLTASGTTPDAIRAATALPEGTPYAWVAGESSTVKTIRRHLVRDRAVDRKRVNFSGYWRRGASEDNLLATNEDA